MAESTKDKLRKAQIDVDHWQKLGEGMTPEQMFDQAGQAVMTHPGNRTLNRGWGAARKKGYKKGGLVKKGKK